MMFKKNLLNLLLLCVASISISSAQTGVQSAIYHSNIPHQNVAYESVKTDDGGALLIATSRLYGYIEGHGALQLFKADSNGTQEWDLFINDFLPVDYHVKNLNGSNETAIVYEFRRTGAYCDVFVSTPFKEIKVLKINDAGVVVSDTVLDKICDDDIVDVTMMDDGFVVFVDDHVSWYNGIYAKYFEKLDYDGNSIWSVAADYLNNQTILSDNDNIGGFLAATEENNLVTLRSFDSNGGIIDTLVLPNSINQDPRKITVGPDSLYYLYSVVADSMTRIEKIDVNLNVFSSHDYDFNFRDADFHKDAILLTSDDLDYNYYYPWNQTSHIDYDVHVHHIGTSGLLDWTRTYGFDSTDISSSLIVYSDSLFSVVGTKNYYTQNDTLISKVFQIFDTISSSSACTGQVLTSTGVPLENAKILFIAFNPVDSSITAVDSAYTDVNGNYTLPSLQGNYYVKAVPDSSAYPNETPTYYQHSSVFQFAQSVVCDSALNFSTIPGLNPGGPGFIGGYIGAGAGKNNAIGQPISGLDVVLVNDNADKVKIIATDDDGYFYFDDIPCGDYKIWIDDLRVDNLLAPTISLVNTACQQDDLMFVIENKQLTLVDSTVTIREYILDPAAIKVSPNPTKDLFAVNINAWHHGGVVQVSNMLGQIVYTGSFDKSHIQISSKTWGAGMYYIAIQDAQGLLLGTNKIMVNK